MFGATLDARLAFLAGAGRGSRILISSKSSPPPPPGPTEVALWLPKFFHSLDTWSVLDINDCICAVSLSPPFPFCLIRGDDDSSFSRRLDKLALAMNGFLLKRAVDIDLSGLKGDLSF